MNKIIRVACYVRVSSDEQKKHGFSIGNQKDRLVNYIHEHPNMQLVGIYADEGVSADKLNKRLEMKRLLDDCNQGKIDLILFTKLDRWFRSVPKYYKIQEILDNCKVSWQAIEEDYETLTANGKFKVNIMLSVAQQERDRCSERIKSVFEYKVKNKEPISGSTCLGFMIATVDGKKRLVHDPEEEEMVKDLIQYYMVYQNLVQTQKYILDKYGVDLCYNSMYRLLQNPLLYGHYSGVDNFAEPYITKKQYDDLQIKFENNQRNRKNSNVYILSKLIICPHCGGRMVGHIDHHKRSRYRCEQRYRNSKIEKQCDFTKSKYEKYIIDQLKEKLNDYMKDYVLKYEIEEKKSVNISNIKKELDRLNNLYIKGRLEEDEYEKRYNELNSKLVIPKKKDTSNIKALLKENILEAYDTLDPEEQSAFWHGLIKAIYIDDDFNITSIDFF